MTDSLFKPPESPVIAIIGLGYVGLPLAVEFGRHYDTIGFDRAQARVDELQQGKDKTLEVEPEELRQAKRLRYATDPDELAPANVSILTVPTPIDAHKRPDPITL